MSNYGPAVNDGIGGTFYSVPSIILLFARRIRLERFGAELVARREGRNNAVEDSFPDFIIFAKARFAKFT